MVVTRAKAQIVGYADDFLVRAHYQGSRISGFIETKIESWMDLELNREKTKVVDLRQDGSSLNFLGYTFRYDRDLHGRGFQYLNATPSNKALQSCRNEIRQKVNRHHCFVPVTEFTGKPDAGNPLVRFSDKKRPDQ